MVAVQSQGRTRGAPASWCAQRRAARLQGAWGDRVGDGGFRRIADAARHTWHQARAHVRCLNSKVDAGQGKSNEWKSILCKMSDLWMRSTRAATIHCCAWSATTAQESCHPPVSNSAVSNSSRQQHCDGSRGRAHTSTWREKQQKELIVVAMIGRARTSTRSETCRLKRRGETRGPGSLRAR